MVYHNSDNKSELRTGFSDGFTMLEVIVAIALVGIGITSTVAALTKLNAFAGASRNATGAYTAVVGEIDQIQSSSPFNPLAGQVPPALTLGNHPAIAVQIYRDPVSGAVIWGAGTSTVTDISTPGVAMYQATVTVNYTYLNRPYSFSMNTIRASDQ